MLQAGRSIGVLFMFVVCALAGCSAGASGVGEPRLPGVGPDAGAGPGAAGGAGKIGAADPEPGSGGAGTAGAAAGAGGVGESGSGGNPGDPNPSMGGAGAAGGDPGDPGSGGTGTGGSDASSGGSGGAGGDPGDPGSSGSGGGAGSDPGASGSGGAPDPGASGAGGGSAGTGGSGPSTPPVPPTRDEFCAGGGPAIVVPDATGPGPVCTPTLGRRLFTHALCACDDVTFAGYLKTRSFSSSGYGGLLALGAPVGINDQLVSGSYVDVGGTLRIAGATSFAGYLEVGGDLELQQPLALPGYLEVWRNARIADDVILTAATLGGDLTTVIGKLQPPPWILVGGAWTSVPALPLDTPCACDPAELLDVDAIVADGRAVNDNAAIGLHPDAFAGHVGYLRFALPCGRFHVSEISGIGDLTLEVRGRTALYVGGDVSITGRLDVELGPDAELDLFIGGDLVQIGYGTFGDPARPARLRVYVGGDGDILFVGYQPVGANLYAPRSRLWSAGYIDLEGSLFVRDADSAGYIDITYDRDVLLPGESCPPPPEEPPPPPEEPPPPECSDACDATCGLHTCIAGACAPCATDADCCAPLVCRGDGTCGPLVGPL